MQKIRVGIAGFGLSSEVFHLPFLQAVGNFEVTHVFTSNPNKVRKHLPNATLLKSEQDLVETDSIDLIVVCLPTFLHYRAAKAGLAAGKHVVVEKPFTTTLSEAVELIKLANSRDKLLSVYHNRRWDGDFLTVKKLIESNQLGRITEVSSRYLRYRPQLRKGKWKEQALPGTGALYDIGSHLIDQALQLFGVPLTVSASISKERKGADVDDSFELTLSYNTLTVKLLNSALVEESAARFVINGTKGTYTKHGNDFQELGISLGLKPGATDWGKEPSEMFGRIEFADGRIETVPTAAGCWINFYQQLSRAINAKELNPVTAEQGALVIQIIEAAKASNASGSPTEIKLF